MTGKWLSLLCAGALALPVSAGAEAPAWRALDAASAQISSPQELVDLARDFPDSTNVRLRLINALVASGDRDNGGQQAVVLALRGYAFAPASERVLTGYLEIDYAQLFAQAQAANRRQIEASTLLTTIPAGAQLVEGVARDPKSGDLYATTVVSRALYVKRGEGEWQRLAIDGAGSLSGIAYGAKQKLLWIASGYFDQTPGEKVGSALLGFDPASGQVVRRLEAGATVPLGDVAVADDGTVFVADPVHGIIYAAAPGDQALRQLVGPGVFRSPQGMIAAPGNRLIVSDYRYGLAVYDMHSGKLTRLAAPKPAMLDGIDGLARRGSSLIAVQNGTSPKRIVRFDMAGDWLSIRRVTVLESDHPGWTEPVGGTIDGDRLLYVATGQWDRFGEGGALVDGAEPGITEVRALPLGK